MTVNHLIDAVAEHTGQTKARTKLIIDVAFEEIARQLSLGDDVQLPGFGTFSVADRPARQGRNPRTGEAIHIAAQRKAKLKMAKALRELLNPVRLVPREVPRRRA